MDLFETSLSFRFIVALCFYAASLRPDSSQPFSASLGLLNGLRVCSSVLIEICERALIIVLRLILESFCLTMHRTAVPPTPAKRISRFKYPAPSAVWPLLYQPPSMRYLLKLIVCVYRCTYTHAAPAGC